MLALNRRQPQNHKSSLRFIRCSKKRSCPKNTKVFFVKKTLKANTKGNFIFYTRDCVYCNKSGYSLVITIFIPKVPKYITGDPIGGLEFIEVMKQILQDKPLIWNF